MKYTIILVFLMSSQLLTAQSKKNNKSIDDGFYIGLNTTNILKNVLSFNSNEIDDPYSLVAYKRWDNVAFRTGVGFRFRSLLNSSNAFADNSNSTFYLRLGIQKFKHLWNKFSMFYGFDIFSSWEKDISVLQNFTNKDIIMSYGGGPVLGFHYQLNERVSISTESSLYFKYSQKETVFNTKGTAEESVKSEIFTFRHLLPNSLYIYFRF